ncbi:TPA: hypothetical protein L1360_004846, partial [Escherichia coli]|nr:hypothetical protein [Escherichia coli]
MKVPSPLSSSALKNIEMFNEDRNQNDDNWLSYKNVSSVVLPPEFRPGENIFLDNKANIIKRFIRKTIAAQTYSTMFSQGKIFKSLNISLNPPSEKKSSFQSIAHLNTVSKRYL